MSDKLELDAEKTTQTARPIFWFIGFAGIMLLGAIVYGIEDAKWPRPRKWVYDKENFKRGFPKID